MPSLATSPSTELTLEPCVNICHARNPERWFIRLFTHAVFWLDCSPSLFCTTTIDHFEDDRHSDEVWTLVSDSVHWVWMPLCILLASWMTLYKLCHCLTGYEKNSSCILLRWQQKPMEAIFMFMVMINEEEIVWNWRLVQFWCGVVVSISSSYQLFCTSKW